MKFKINDIVTTKFGVGKIVYVDNSALPYLVHIDGFDGHNGNLAGPAIQDNSNNWWFFEECLELVKHNDNKYKVGDLVRVINFHHKFNDRISLVNEVTQNWFGDTIYGVDFIPNHVQCENIEPITHLTTKEFIKLVEDMGYEAEGEYRIGVKKDEFSRTLATVSVYDIFELNTISSEFKELQNKELLFKILTLYATTPIELRGEPKKYTLELPNTTIKARYFRFGLPHAKHSYKFGALPKSTTNSDIDYQAYFTQKEIDRLPNQELIKTLKKEPVK